MVCLYRVSAIDTSAFSLPRDVRPFLSALCMLTRLVLVNGRHHGRLATVVTDNQQVVGRLTQHVRRQAASFWFYRRENLDVEF